MYGRNVHDANEMLVPTAQGEIVRTDAIEAHKLTTNPPACDTEATMPSAMEGAGKRVEEDELRAAMYAKGLGTPDTRAAIIEGLLTEKYLIREARDLTPTAKVHQLM